MMIFGSLQQFDDLLDIPNHAHDIIHQLISINCLDLQLPTTLHTLLLVSLLASQTVIVTTRYNRHRVLQFVTEWTLNLRNYAVVDRL